MGGEPEAVLIQDHKKSLMSEEAATCKKENYKFTNLRKKRTLKNGSKRLTRLQSSISIKKELYTEKRGKEIKAPVLNLAYSENLGNI